MTRRKLTLDEKLKRARDRLRLERYDRERIADALQESVLRALQKGFDLDRLPVSWFVTTSRRIAIDALRRDSRQIPTDHDKLDRFAQTSPQTGK